MMKTPSSDSATRVPAVLPPAGAAHLRRAFDLCVRKTRSNITDLARDPKTWSHDVHGRYENFREQFFDIGNWTSSFFTGMALLAWRETEDEYFLKQVLSLAPAYREKVFVRYLETHHDLGFLYTLYSVALFKLTHAPEHREVGLRAAELLSQRFNPVGNFIRAWGRVDENEPAFPANIAIIDSLMNLPLLYWAANEAGEKNYRQIAVRHADMTLKHFIRPDGSVCHARRFDLGTGCSTSEDNFCGFSKDSYWSRGAAWAIYGFALSHTYTGDVKYLEAAVQLTRKFLAQLDGEVVPAWDFRLAPGVEPTRDASAAVIAVCGIQELTKHAAADAQMLRAKDTLLRRVCSDDYLDGNANCRGVLKSAYGSKPAYSSWGDYFLMEACARELFLAPAWW